MIFGIGCDLVEIERIKGSYTKLGASFLKRIFSDEEVEFSFSKKNPFPSLAARFAAKEALSKALGVGIGAYFSWHDCAITQDELKKPEIKLSLRVVEHFGPLIAHVSLSHTDRYAMAYVILETTHQENVQHQ